MLPVQESSREVRVSLEDSPYMDIRLAADTIDYYVLFALPEGKDRKTVSFDGLCPGALCWTSLKAADEIPPVYEEKYRPVYHHSPRTGWMNDPNGMFYKDGEYHLYYQYNPYGNRWGNMHWAHSSSRDLVNWTNHSVVLAPDSLGTIFSGSAVVDKDNTAGFGQDAVVVFYTADRTIAIAWMSAWPYANRTPTEQFRSVNSIPRDIKLFSSGDDIYASASPSEELSKLRGSSSEVGAFSLGKTLKNEISVGDYEAYEVNFNLRMQPSTRVSVVLCNAEGEKFSLKFDNEAMTVLADRSASGKMTEIESFVKMPEAPLGLCAAYDGYDVEIFVDKCSVEVFVDGGRIAMANLVFPSSAFDRIVFEGEGESEINGMNIYELEK